jgi:plastocyanin
VVYQHREEPHLRRDDARGGTGVCSGPGNLRALGSVDAMTRQIGGIAMRFRRVAVAFLGFLLVLVVPAVPAVAGGGGGGGGPCSGFTRGSAISIQDSCFQGAAHFVKPNATVEVTNDGEAPHDFTAVDGSFASGILQPGDTFELTVDDAGILRYYCTLHGTSEGGGMAGVLVVGDSEAALPASTDNETRSADAALASANPVSQDTTGLLVLAVAALVIATVALTVGLRAQVARLRSSPS